MSPSSVILLLKCKSKYVIFYKYDNPLSVILLL